MAEIPRPFGALLTAMVTPFNEDGSLDEAGLQALARHLVDLGHDGIVVSGTTGESPTTTDAEKQRIIELAKEAVEGQAQIVAGVGTFDTAHTVELAKEAADAGADGLLVVSPYYSRPCQAGMIQHFLRAADATELPVMVYDIPIRSAVHLDPATVRELAGHEQIVAVKDATGDLARAFGLGAVTGLAWYSGDDKLNLPFLAQGAAGMVSVVGQVVGDRWRSVIDAIDAGNIDKARQVTAQIWPVVNAICGGGHGVTMVKAALEMAGLIERRTVRLPLFEPTEVETGRVRQSLMAARVSIKR
ncbi:MAG: 4-hydroxy-tetrahydrodipicolinate synthase [Micrococcales bacterium]|nr:4-hydroxy-tetrahydrodipicolinate synthase [Micrococcales bacterium]